MTAEQLLGRAGDGRAELVRGELVELMPVGQFHGWLVCRLLGWLIAFPDENKLGRVGTEIGMVLARDPDLVRAPDISFVSKERVANPTSTQRDFLKARPISP